MARQRWIPWALAIAFVLPYSALSVSRHLHLESTAYDLGIFEQALRSYAELRAPVSELKGAGFNLLGDHFHPALALLAPLYRLFPSPVTLLVAQAVLLAVSVVPVARFAIEARGCRDGAFVGIAYGLSWGIQQAVWFDFHEVALAVPLLAVSARLLARRRWGAAVLWALPLLLVKEDQALTVAAIGAYVCWRGRRGLGAAVAGVAVLAGVLTVLVVVPALNPGHVYPYASVAQPAGADPLTRFLLPAAKAVTVLALLAPTAFMALRSPLVLLAVPTLAARYWAANPFYWGTGFHYSATLMPVLFVAFVDGLERLGPSPDPFLRRLRVAAPSVALLLAVAMTAHGQPLRALAEPTTWRLPPGVPAAHAALAVIPDGADVAATNRLAPQLTSRCRVFLFRGVRAGDVRPEWVAVNVAAGFFPGSPAEEAAVAGSLGDAGYVPVARGGGVTVYRLDPAGGRRAASSAAARPGSPASVMARTSTTRRAPAASTSSRVPRSMPPIANQGIGGSRAVTAARSPGPVAGRPGLVAVAYTGPAAR
jgi:uncharacterized membrane protein